MILFALLLACTAATDDTAAADPSCGDVDAGGTDTGDVPTVTGLWASSYGVDWFSDGCTVDNFDATSEGWITGGMTISGSLPDRIYAYFGPSGTPETERFWGAVDLYGGFTLTGEQPHSEGGTIHASFGGLVFHDVGTNRDVISGAVTLALDVDNDKVIDCYSRGDWEARKSGG
jgi:hypothetical protein